MGRRKKRDSTYISGLDIGTTKTCLITGELTGEGLICRTLSTLPSEGVRKGIVTDPDACGRVIGKLLNIGRAESGIPVSEVYVAMPGTRIEVIETSGAVNVKGARVTFEETERAIQAAVAASVPEDREILHVTPSDFMLDGKSAIPNPVGMSGTSLEVRVLVLTAAINPVREMLACLEKAGIGVTDIVLQSLAAAESSLTMKERMAGIALADIGGGTTDLAIFQGGWLRHAYSIGVAGFHLTNDLSIGLGMPFADAEDLKKSHGTVLPAAMEKTHEHAFGATGENLTGDSLAKLAGILRPRAEEIIELIDAQIALVNSAGMPVTGLVLTGGSVLLTGMDRLAEAMLGMPVRIGQPNAPASISLSDGQKPVLIRLPGEAASPACAAAVGLLFHGAAESLELKRAFTRPRLYSRLMSTLSGWFKGKSGGRQGIPEEV